MFRVDRVMRPKDTLGRLFQRPVRAVVDPSRYLELFAICSLFRFVLMSLTITSSFVRVRQTLPLVWLIQGLLWWLGGSLCAIFDSDFVRTDGLAFFRNRINWEMKATGSGLIEFTERPGNAKPANNQGLLYRYNSFAFAWCNSLC